MPGFCSKRDIVSYITHASCKCTAGCYITQWKLGIKHIQACCGNEVFNILVIVSVQGKCSNGQWLAKSQSPATAQEYRMIPEQPDGYFKLTGQSGGWLTGMLDCCNERDGRWEATAKTEQGQDCKVVAYQLRLDGGCAGARFGFDGPGQQKPISDSIAWLCHAASLALHSVLTFDQPCTCLIVLTSGCCTRAEVSAVLANCLLSHNISDI